MNKNNFLSKTFIVLFIFIFFIFTSPSFISASEINSEYVSKLTIKLAKNYTNKFCNGIAFGLSQDSALTFALNENKQAFKNKKGIELINEDDLSTQISINVVEKCGTSLSLNGNQGVDEFKQFFIDQSNKAT